MDTNKILMWHIQRCLSANWDDNYKLQKEEEEKFQLKMKKIKKNK